MFIHLPNFPIVTETNVVIEQFGSTGVYFGTSISIISSNVDSTILQVQVPAFPVAKNEVNAPMVVKSVRQTNRVSVPYNLHFQKKGISIESLKPTQASVLGGTTVYIQVAFFSVGLDNNVIAFEFGDVLVHPQNNSVTSSAVESKIMLIVTPQSDAGMVKGRIYLKTKGRSTSMLFDFKFIDDFSPAICAPFPARSCISTEGQTETIWVTYLQENIANCSQVNVSFGMYDEGKARVLSRERGLARLVVNVPSIANVSGSVIATLVTEFGRIEFEYEFVDCSVPAIEQINPTSGINLGGTTINIRFSNWAKIVLPISSFQTANGLVLSEMKDGTAFVLKINAPKITIRGVTDAFIIGSLNTGVSVSICASVQ